MDGRQKVNATRCPGPVTLSTVISLNWSTNILKKQERTKELIIGGSILKEILCGQCTLRVLRSVATDWWSRQKKKENKGNYWITNQSRLRSKHRSVTGTGASRTQVVSLLAALSQKKKKDKGLTRGQLTTCVQFLFFFSFH